MARYFQHTRPRVMEEFTPLPLQLIGAKLGQKQAQRDAIKGQLESDDYRIQGNVIPTAEEQQRIGEIRQNIEGRTADIKERAFRPQSENTSQLLSDIVGLNKDYKRAQTEAKIMTENRKAYDAYIKDLKGRGYSSELESGLLEQELTGFTGTGFDPTTQEYRTFTPQGLVDRPETREVAFEIADEIETQIFESTPGWEWDANINKWVNIETRTESLPFERIKKITHQTMLSDPRIQDYIALGDRVNIDLRPEIEDMAINAANAKQVANKTINSKVTSDPGIDAYRSAAGASRYVTEQELLNMPHIEGNVAQLSTADFNDVGFDFEAVEEVRSLPDPNVPGRRQDVSVVITTTDDLQKQTLNQMNRLDKQLPGVSDYVRTTFENRFGIPLDTENLQDVAAKQQAGNIPLTPENYKKVINAYVEEYKEDQLGYTVTRPLLRDIGDPDRRVETMESLMGAPPTKDEDGELNYNVGAVTFSNDDNMTVVLDDGTTRTNVTFGDLPKLLGYDEDDVQSTVNAIGKGAPFYTSRKNNSDFNPGGVTIRTTGKDPEKQVQIMLSGNVEQQGTGEMFGNLFDSKNVPPAQLGDKEKQLSTYRTATPVYNPVASQATGQTVFNTLASTQVNVYKDKKGNAYVEEDGIVYVPSTDEQGEVAYNQVPKSRFISETGANKYKTFNKYYVVGTDNEYIPMSDNNYADIRYTENLMTEYADVTNPTSNITLDPNATRQGRVIGKKHGEKRQSFSTSTTQTNR